MNVNAMRPPSRHKVPSQNVGLELPPDDEDIPVLDEDSDSSDEFEIGIEKAGGFYPQKVSNNKQNAQNQNPHNTAGKFSNKIPSNKTKPRLFQIPDKQWVSDSEEEEAVSLEEPEFQFDDNPVLKDFFNLSNGGGRVI